MSTEAEPISDTFTQLYSGWVEALQQRDYSWFEKHIAEDFSCSAHPILGLTATKRQFIEGEETIESLKVQTLQVHAHAVNGIAISIWVAKILEEVLNPRALEIYGPNFPSLEKFSALVKNKTMVYMDAWRKNGDVWQCFNHHMVGPSD